MLIAWPIIGYILFLAGGLACALAAAVVWHRRARLDRLTAPLLIALSATGIWALASAAFGPLDPLAEFAETARNLTLLFLLYRLFALAESGATTGAIRSVIFVLCVVEALQVPFTGLRIAGGDGAAPLTTTLHALGVVGALVLLHNLYAGSLGRRHSRLAWPIFGLAQLWVWDLNFHTTAFLADGHSPALAALRGLTALGMGGLLAIGALGSDDLRFRPSRAATFQSVSLLLIAAYLLVMIGAAQWLSFFGGSVGGLAAAGLIFAMSVLALIAWPSPRLRGWAKVIAAKHLFQHRYDYRAEWLRFTQTVGRGDDSALPLEQRLIRALADITDSPSGLLFLPDDSGQCEVGARWQWPALDETGAALPAGAAAFFEQGGYIVELDLVRRGRHAHGEDRAVSAWLLDDPRAWALVPLLHFGRLVGVVALGRPALDRRLDWEDLDMLRTVGCQSASYLAEHAGQEALLEANRFDEFNRRIAFVMHDIKNLASQLSLLSRNAERHAENPDFRADMLITLRNSADKLNGLLTRLSRYGGSQVAAQELLNLGHFVRTTVLLNPRQHSVLVVDAQDCRILANAELLEQVLVHLIQNAIDASPPGLPVTLRVFADGLYGCVEVADSGAGMSAEFVRSRLFKPFVSSKPGGFGIGAFEAREHVRAMQGKLDVDSREGIGSRFTVRLPLAAAADLVAAIHRDEPAPRPAKVA